MKMAEEHALLAVLTLALSAGAGQSHAASNVMQMSPVESITANRLCRLCAKWCER